MNEVPHPGFDKPEEYETFTTTNGLEEAAWDCVLDSVDVNNPVLLAKYKELLLYLFKAGAKWQKEQMMKKAVPFYEILKVVPPGPERDKVKLIICKEEN